MAPPGRPVVGARGRGEVRGPRPAGHPPRRRRRGCAPPRSAGGRPDPDRVGRSTRAAAGSDMSVLLTIDAGNTNTVLGVHDGADLKAHWRLTTRREQTADEYGILVRNLFAASAL